MASGGLGRESRPGLAEDGGQHPPVGPVRHRQDLQEAPGRRLGAGQHGVEHRRVRAPRIRHVLRRPRDAAAEHASELAKEDRVPLGERLEALLAQPEEPRGRQRDHGGRARVARDQRHLPQAVPGSQDGDPLARPAALPADLHGSAHDHVEGVAGVALREHRAAGGNLDLVELAHEAGEHLARELGEQRHGPERGDDRVHRDLVADARRGESLCQGACASGSRQGRVPRVSSAAWSRSTS